MTNKQYQQLTKSHSPGSHVVTDCLAAFFTGGAICVIGQLLLDMYKAAGLNEVMSATACSISLVTLSIFFTGLGWYQKLAKHAGAGTLVPITGFANAMCSPAIEFKNEGYVLGVGAKMFSIAGPVIVYGLAAAFIYGIVLLIVGLFA